MTAKEARKVVKLRLDAAGAPYLQLRAKTVSFMDLAGQVAVFVDVKTAMPGLKATFADIPKPPQGGFIARYM